MKMDVSSWTGVKKRRNCYFSKDFLKQKKLQISSVMRTFSLGEVAYAKENQIQLGFRSWEIPLQKRSRKTNQDSKALSEKSHNQRPKDCLPRLLYHQPCYFNRFACYGNGSTELWRPLSRRENLLYPRKKRQRQQNTTC